MGVQEYEPNEEEHVQRVRRLLVNAPADKAWRRRGLLLLCIARHRARQRRGDVSDFAKRVSAFELREMGLFRTIVGYLRGKVRRGRQFVVFETRETEKQAGGILF